MVTDEKVVDCLLYFDESVQLAKLECLLCRQSQQPEEAMLNVELNYCFKDLTVSCNSRGLV